jgi:hypothetical protein
MRYHVTLSLILFTLISGCSKTDNHDTNDTTQEQSTLQAPIVENAPASTTMSSVTVTVRTLPNSEVYLQELHVATSNNEGIAYVTLELGETGSTQTFSFKVKKNNRFSESVVVSIARRSSENNNTSTSSTNNTSSTNSATSQSASSINAQSSQSSSVSIVIPVSSSSVAVSSNASVSSTAISSASSSSSAPVNPLKTLTLTADTLELAEGNTTSLHVNATYKDGTTRTSNSGLQWSIDDTTKASITGSTLTALKEGTTALHVSQNTITSNTLHITIYKTINGHRLPPEPDETLNNSTLLGIDTNNNGVRDDVERWIYETYDTYIPCTKYDENVTISTGATVLVRRTQCEDHAVPYHPIVREIAMQAARAAQIIIQEPEKARETTKLVEAAIDCEAYFKIYASDYGDPILIPNQQTIFTSKEFKNIQFNTTQRVRAFSEYNYYLSGGVYELLPEDKIKALCDFNVTKMLKVQP